jgi:hypothetical protein
MKKRNTVSAFIGAIMPVMVISIPETMTTLP